MDAAFQQPASAIPGMQAQQQATPTTGQTVQITNNALLGLTVINPAGTLGALTVALPLDASSSIGQIERIAFMKAITALTINAGAGMVYGVSSTALLGDNIAFQKIAANTWTRLL